MLTGEQQVTRQLPPELSPLEWNAVAVALRDADAGTTTQPVGRLSSAWRLLTGAQATTLLADPKLEALRAFVCYVRRYRRVDEKLADRLNLFGFNNRQIEALVLLSV